MLKLNERGVIVQFLTLLILAVGIGTGLYLVKTGNLKLFSKAVNNQTRIEFVDSGGNPITQTSSQQVKLKLTYVASSDNSFSVGTNVTGITHYGYADNNPDCLASAPYEVGGSPLPSPTSGGTGANLYVDPKNIDLQSSASVTATADTKCSGNITQSFADGLTDCKGGCGTGGVTDGCTCSGGNPKDTKSCWWRWTCTAAATGSYTASFNSAFSKAAASDLDADLAEMKRMGMKVIRVFAANKYIADEEAANRLGVFLDKANQYGISVIISLIDFYNSGFSPQGTEQYYTGNYNGIGLLGDEFFAGGYQSRYKEFVKAVVLANKDKSNIYAWEAGNELADSSNPQTLIAFMKDITATIKSIDSQHAIATGMLNAGHTGLTPQSLYSELPDVNLITVHAYDGDRSGFLDVEWAKSNSKNVIMEEFGFSGTGDRSAQYKNEIDYWKSLGVSAILQWGFMAKGLSDNGNGDNKYGMDNIWHTDYDVLASLFQSYGQTINSFPTHFKVANSSSELASASEQEFNMNGKIIDWDLAGEAGVQTVYVQFKVDDQWQDPLSAKITLINPSPTPTPVLGGRKVNICHKIGSGKKAFQVISIDKGALDIHIAHGDIYPVPANGCFP